MTTIKILPEILSNQIAAGEVVERPASVVKELVENSIDAKATRISVEIKNGGKSLIRVCDDGIGLSKDDAILAIERYATSKLVDQEGLFSIATMGFRGEALPSIASVSKFCLTSRPTDSDIATQLEIVGGKLRDVSDAGAPVGTMVEVKSLFFNTPARKKFLKADTTETGHIADTMAGVALGHPDIEFKFSVNGRVAKHYYAREGAFARTVNVLGKDTSNSLYPIDYKQDGLSISGFCANPMITRSTSSRIYLFVNNRLIYDRGLISAIFQGYKGRIMKGRFPLASIFVNIGFDQVDVNVHPSKKQVRFFNHQQVYQAVSLCVSQALLKAQEQESQYSKVADSDPESNSQIPSPGEQEQTEQVSYPFSRQEEISSQVEQSTISWKFDKSSIQQSDPDIEMPSEPPGFFQKEDPDLTFSKFDRQDNDTLVEPQENQSTQLDLRIIGQVMGTYILVEVDQELRLIDQHAAHERIVYESLLKRHSTLERASQQLMVPETLELNFKEAEALKTILKDLCSIGFIVEPFGGTTFIVKAVPVMIGNKESHPIIMEIIENIVEQKWDTTQNKWLEELLITMACHGAIRANKQMNGQEMEKLIQELEMCDNPMHCPHGRPTMITITRDQLEKLFKRIG